MKTDRHIAAKLVRQILKNEISFEQFVDQYPTNTNDNKLIDLFDLIEHQPKQGGAFGVSRETFDEYNSRITKLINELEQ